jgi:DNA repair exonuclease SbcCD nuclease subunit
MAGMVRIVHCADIHLGCTAGLGERTRDHQARIAQAFERVVNLAAQQADLLLIVGDLLNSDAVYGSFVERAVGILHAALQASPKLWVVIVAGNHDPPPVYQRREWQVLGERVLMVTEPQALPLEAWELTVVALPWRAGEELSWGKWPAQGQTIVAAHACFPPPPKADPQDCVLTEREVANWPVAYVALGHYHSFGEHRVGSIPVVYSGAPEILDPSQAGIGRAVLVTLEPGAPARYEPIPTGSLRGLGEMVIRWHELPQPREEQLRQQLRAHTSKEALLRVRLQGLRERPLEEMRAQLAEELADQFYCLDIRDDTRPAADLASIASGAAAGLGGRVAEIARRQIEALRGRAEAALAAGNEEEARQAQEEAVVAQDAANLVLSLLQGGPGA